MKNTYSFFAVFDQEEAGYNIWFPDLDGCYSCAEVAEQIPQRAKEALELWLYSLQEDGEEIPAARKLNEIELKEGQSSLLVVCNLRLVREQMENKSIKKTLTIPAWLNTRAEAAGVNFSQVLQEALREKLAL